MKTILLATCAMLYLSQAARAQSPFWTQPQGSGGGTFDDVYVAEDGTLFVRGSAGLLRSSGGDTWEIANTVAYWPIAARGNGTLLAGFQSKVYASTDNGTSWTPLHTEPLEYDTGQIPIFSLVNAGDSLLLASGFKNLFISRDSGSSWTDISGQLQDPGFQTGIIEAFAISPSGVIVAALWRKGVYRSDDLGENWSLIHAATNNDLFRTAVVAADGHVYIGGGGILLKSTDLNWTGVTALGQPDGTASILGLAAGTDGYIYAASHVKGLFRTNNAGATWTTFPSVGGTVNDVSVNSAGVVATAGSGVHVSTNNGASWTEANTGWHNVFVSWIGKLQDGTAIAVGNGRTFRSTDAGMSWNDTPGDILARWIAFNGTVYGAAIGKLYKSGDNGNSWEEISPAFGNASSLAFGPDGAVYVALLSAGQHSLYRTDDEGVTWTTLAIPEAGNVGQNVAVTGAGTVLFGTYNTFVRSADRGGSWSAGMQCGVVECSSASWIHVDGQGNLFMREHNRRFYRTDDDGLTWTSFDAGSNDAERAFMSDPEVGLLAGSSQGEVLHSTDQGASWKDISAGITPGSALSGFVVSESGHVLAATTNGLYRSVDPIGTSIEDEHADLPLTATRILGANYPNPLTTHTTIPFSLDVVETARLELFDALGRRVATLVNGTRPAGDHRVEVDATTLTSGLYYYQLSTTRATETRSMLVVR